MDEVSLVSSGEAMIQSQFIDAVCGYSFFIMQTMKSRGLLPPRIRSAPPSRREAKTRHIAVSLGEILFTQFCFVL